MCLKGISYGKQEPSSNHRRNSQHVQKVDPQILVFYISAGITQLYKHKIWTSLHMEPIIPAFLLNDL